MAGHLEICNNLISDCFRPSASVIGSHRAAPAVRRQHARAVLLGISLNRHTRYRGASVLNGRSLVLIHLKFAAACPWHGAAPLAACHHCRDIAAVAVSMCARIIAAAVCTALARAAGHGCEFLSFFRTFCVRLPRITDERRCAMLWARGQVVTSNRCRSRKHRLLQSVHPVSVHTELVSHAQVCAVSTSTVHQLRCVADVRAELSSSVADVVVVLRGRLTRL